MGNTKTQWRGRLWRYAPLILWIIIIFVASSNTGSMSNTSRIIGPLILFFFPETDNATLLAVQIAIRKIAHFVFYFILGALAARAFSGSSARNLKKYWFPAAFLLVVAVAVSDETNQSFLASRTASVRDVLLDSAGGLTALFIWYLIFGLKRFKSSFQS